MARTHTFKGSASAGYGYFAYIEDGQLVIGEDWGREGGILYKGPYAHVDKHTMRLLENNAPKLYKSITEYYIEQAKKEEANITHQFEDSRDANQGCGYFGYIENGLLVLGLETPGGCEIYFRGPYAVARSSYKLGDLKCRDKVLYNDIEKHFTKHGVSDESDRKITSSKDRTYTVRLMMNNGKELDAVISGESETEVIRKILPPVPDTIMLYDLEGRVIAVRSDKIYTVAILD